MTIEFITPGWPAPRNVQAQVSTRFGGISTGPFTSLNLGDHVGDDPVAVSENRQRLRAHLPGEPAWMKQVHGTRCVDAAAVAPGVEADAAITRRPGIVCAVLTADCLPVLLCDSAGAVVGIAHAGWRGLAAGIIESTVAAMDCPPDRLMAWLGPAIGPARFEVGEDVRDEFIAEDPAAAAAFLAGQPGKWLCNLYLLARQRLEALGIGEVSGGDACTFRDATRFFSYRRDGTTGRMASLIWLSHR